MKASFAALASLALFSTLTPQLSTAFAQGTAFTYQGRLNSNGAPANGSYDVAFTLFATNTTGSAIAGPVTNPAVAVSNGLFTTIVDFGNAYTGESNWLEIAVSTNGANAFNTLTPRQQLTPVPYAIFAATASNLDGTLPATQISGPIGSANLSGTYGNALTLSNAANNFTGSFSGNGAGVSNVNATALNGLNATNFWKLSGNAVAAGQILGSTNNQALEVRVGNQRALLITTNPADSANFIGGSPANAIDAGVEGAVIAGGGTTNFLGSASSNHVSVNFSTIAGGSGNWIQPGADHSFIGAGLGNLISSNDFQSVITGGQNNTNQSTSSVIGGGNQNSIQLVSQYSMIGGGQQNTIESNSFYSMIGGGQQNTIGSNAYYSMIGGGQQNVIQGNSLVGADYSTIAGGENNTIDAISYDSMVGGGQYNSIGNSPFGTVGGGYSNAVTAYAGVVVGGQQNVAGGENATVGGGVLNQALGNGSVIAGGGFDGNNNVGNLASGTASFVGGGVLNTANNTGSFVGGGGEDATTDRGNTASGVASVVVGGYGNTASGAGAFVGGGGDDEVPSELGNTASGGASVVVGGLGNNVSADYSAIGGGKLNTNSSWSSVIGGGQRNAINTSGSYHVIAGGYQNNISAIAISYAAIGGGNGNNVSGTYGTIAGGSANTVVNTGGVIAGGIANTIAGSGTEATISGGFQNTNLGGSAMIPGGRLNLATGTYSLAAGYQAQATNNGSFVWADGEGTPFGSTTANQFNVRANGGVRFVTAGAGMTVDGQPVLINGGSSTAIFNGGAIFNGTLYFPDQNVTAYSGFNTFWHSDTNANFSIGYSAGDNLGIYPAGASNTAVGYQALASDTNGAGNTAVGLNALLYNLSGNYNTAIGDAALSGLGGTVNAGGNNNIALGYQAGSGFSFNESSNIDIGNVGVVGENNTIRIGTPGIQTKAVIAGVITGNGSGLTNVWQTGGNSGTSPGGNYLGTSDNQALELHVDGIRALRLEPTSGGSGVPNVIGGWSGNLEDNSSQGVTIGGGGASGFVNHVSSSLGTIAGGSGNVININANDSTIGGGRQNTIDTNSWGGVIGGGHGNWIQTGNSSAGGFLGNPSYSVIGGGYGNVVGTNINNATIGGGGINTNSGSYATIPGGYENLASAAYALAAGQNAQATNTGALVWSDDSSSSAFTSTNNNSFSARAAGGFQFYTTSSGRGGAGLYVAPGGNSWVTISDRNAKKDFAPVNYQAVLDKLAEVPIEQWHYQWESDRDTPNIGPMAQDFIHAFYPGRDDKGISTLEFDGVELAAIQGLNQKLAEKDAEIADLKARLEKIETLINARSGETK